MRYPQGAMWDKWSQKVDQKTLYDLFPPDQSKRGGRIAGLPESRREGGHWPRRTEFAREPLRCAAAQFLLQ